MGVLVGVYGEVDPVSEATIDAYTKGFANSRRVHPVLAKLWKPWFTERGWKRSRSGACEFIPDFDFEYNDWRAWIQLSQYGNSLEGNKFWIACGPFPPHPERLAEAPKTSVYRELFSEEDKYVAAQIENEILLSIPAQQLLIDYNATDKAEIDPDLLWVIESLADSITPRPDRWTGKLTDVWFRYHSERDVLRWGEFLLARFDQLFWNIPVRP